MVGDSKTSSPTGRPRFGGMPIDKLTASYDLDPSRQSEEEIAAERRFRLVVEAAPNAMMMINRAGEIVIVNAQAERVFGYSRAELLGQPVEMLVPERFRSHHPGMRATFIADSRPRPMGAGRDLYGLKKNGSEFPVEIGLNPIETDEGTMVGDSRYHGAQASGGSVAGVGRPIAPRVALECGGRDGSNGGA
jgi:PAS domain S-box-containing protein